MSRYGVEVHVQCGGLDHIQIRKVSGYVQERRLSLLGGGPYLGAILVTRDGGHD